MVRGPVERLSDLFGVVDVRGFFALSKALAEQERSIAALNAERGLDTGLPWRATFDQGRFLAGAAPNPFLQCRPEQVRVLFDAGASIQLGDLESLVFGAPEAARIARAAEQLRAALHHPGIVQVGATLSPPGAGFGAHFDPTGAFLVQTAGRKRYRFGRAPLVPWPRGKAYLPERGGLRYRASLTRALEPWEMPARVPDPPFDEEVELAPGDVLYVPPGAVHATAAGEGEPSVALLLIFGQTSARALIAMALDAALGPREEFRGLPTFVGSHGGGLPEHVREALDARLRDAIGALEELRRDPYQQSRVWRRLSSDALALAPPRARQGPSIEPGTPLVVAPWVREHLAAGRGADGVSRACVLLGEAELEAEGPLAALLVRLAHLERVTGAELLADGLTWEDVAPCLAELVRLGFVSLA